MRTLLLLLFSSNIILAQVNQDFEKFQMSDSKTLISSLALSPDDNYVVATCVQGFPMHIYDWRKRETIKKIDVKGYNAGQRATYSSDGKYLLLEQKFYSNWNPNKDKKSNFLVVDINAGSKLYEIDNQNDASFTADSRFLITMEEEKIIFRDIRTGKEIRSLKIPEATNSFAISRDGKTIAVSHLANKKDLESVPSIRDHKKAIKEALKYRQMISFYDAESGKKKTTVNEVYDIVYKLKYVEDGKTLVCYSIPHSKLQASTAGRQGYINKIDPNTAEASRVSFLSLSSMEPDVKLSHNNKLLGVISVTDKGSPSLNIYDFNSGDMLESINIRTRLGAAFRDGEFGGFWSFTFLPDDKQVLIASGNRLIMWNLKEEL